MKFCIAVGCVMLKFGDGISLMFAVGEVNVDGSIVGIVNWEVVAGIVGDEPAA
jgi:uncharacterized membrane protein YuzA (DUF378 family)